SVLKTIASLTSIFVGIRLGSFVLGLFFDKANEKGVIVGSITSIIAVFAAQSSAISWPWFAPIGTAVFLIFGVVVSTKWGENSKANERF
ncbi:sodium:solute symporter, partial [Vibrio campbellii]